MRVHGFVQAGGASSRFGTDKALVRLGGKTALERTTELVESVCKDVQIVAPAGKYSDVRRRFLADRWPGEGPLGGILTALRYMKHNNSHGARVTEQNELSIALIVGCDMPFLTLEFLMCLRDTALKSLAQVVVPQSSSGLEPLCACWKSTALEGVQSAFDSGVRKVTEAMKRLPIETLDESVWKRFDKNGRLFWNMNTLEDFEEARRILESHTP